jgi:hypothetical protein
MRNVELHRIAHSRTGDKGNRLNVSIIAYWAEDYPLLLDQVTEARVAELLAGRSPGAVCRYELPRLGALNFVIDGALDGGVNQSLNLDGHGKSLSFRILEMRVELPAAGAS